MDGNNFMSGQNPGPMTPMNQPGMINGMPGEGQMGPMMQGMPGIQGMPGMQMAQDMQMPGMQPMQAVPGTEATITSGPTPEEKNKQSQKIVILSLVGLCVGIAVVALAAIVLTNIPRIATLENRIDTISKQNATMQEQIAILNKRIGYDIDLEFFNGETPGTVYTVTLQPDSREVTLGVYAGCSMTSAADCGMEPEVAMATLSQYEYDLVAEAYGKMDGSAVDYTENMKNWIKAIEALIGGDEAVANSTSSDWEIIKIYDADGDNVISSREYGTYLLAQMVK